MDMETPVYDVIDPVGVEQRALRAEALSTAARILPGAQPCDLIDAARFITGEDVDQ